jgi:predicted acyl esterase
MPISTRRCGVGPDGQAAFLSDGGLKASHRESLEAAKERQPGTFYDYDFSIWPIDWKVAPGHRLAVRLSAGSADFFVPPTTPLPTVTVAVGGDAPSYLDLP